MLTLELERLTAYYGLNVIIPCFVFVVLSYGGFYVNRGVAPARIAISVIPVLITVRHPPHHHTTGPQDGSTRGILA